MASQPSRLLRLETLKKDREGGRCAMWRPDIGIVWENLKKNEIEMDRGPDEAARQILITVVMNCQMCLMGTARNLPPPPLTLTYSLFPALLFLSFFSTS